VVTAMDEIIASGAIRPGGNELVAPHSARIVDTTTTVIHQA